MDIKILEEKETPLLARKKIILEVSYPKSSTPSKAAVKKDIANLLKTKEELISLKHIYPKFGQGKATIIANVYQNLKDLKAIEELRKKSKKEKKEAAPAEKPVEAKEQPKEAIKEKPAEKPKEKPAEEKGKAKETKDEVKAK